MKKINEVKRDCWKFREEGVTKAKPECDALTEFICSYKKCSFYKPKGEVNNG